MIFSWLSHDFLLIFSYTKGKYNSHNFIMTFSWFSHDSLTTSSWLSHDFSCFSCFLITFSWLWLTYWLRDWLTATVLKVCSCLDSLQLSWQSATVLTLFNFLNRLSFVTFWPLLNTFPATFWQFYCNFLAPFWQLFDNVLAIFWQLSGNFLASFWQPANNF